MNNNPFLFNEFEVINEKRVYRGVLTATENRKGVLDVDTVKGCSIGMSKYPNGGCYYECYAYKTAKMYGIDFSVSISRKPGSKSFNSVFHAVKDYPALWYRIGTSGDPSHDWENTIEVCERLKSTGKTPIVITKHWNALTNAQIKIFIKVGAIFNTSTSGLDADEEIEHRIEQMDRLESAGIKSICRVVTCKFGTSDWAKKAELKQKHLLSLSPVIDNPLRASISNELVIKGEILLEKRKEAIGGGKRISLHNGNVYLGKCNGCKDQCGFCL